MGSEHPETVSWPQEDLKRIASADELEIASLRQDGTLTRPVTVWVVAHDGDLYVRSWKGPQAAWFRATQARHRGRISAGGVEKDVSFEHVEGGIDDALDAAYRSKYRRHGGSYVEDMVAPTARATTLRLIPRRVPRAGG